MSKQDTVSEKVKKLMTEDQDAVIMAVLENITWPKGVLTGHEYFVREDDSDGERRGVSVHFLRNGDGVVSFEECIMKSVPAEGEVIPDHAYRFRTRAGGGVSILVHSALLLLAKAVTLESDEYFDHSM